VGVVVGSRHVQPLRRFVASWVVLAPPRPEPPARRYCQNLSVNISVFYVTGRNSAVSYGREQFKTCCILVSVREGLQQLVTRVLVHTDTPTTSQRLGVCFGLTSHSTNHSLANHFHQPVAPSTPSIQSKRTTSICSRVFLEARQERDSRVTGGCAKYSLLRRSDLVSMCAGRSEGSAFWQHSEPLLLLHNGTEVNRTSRRPRCS